MTNSEFENIYRIYFQSVYAYMLKLTKNQNIAEEMTSETFFKALRAIDRFEGKCDIRSWLCQIAKNTYLSYLRKNNRVDLVEQLENLQNDTVTIEEMVIQKETSMRIYEVLRTLDEPYREVFTLRTLGELSFRQIGELFQKNENWACVTYYRAKYKIKQEMEEEE